MKKALLLSFIAAGAMSLSAQPAPVAKVRTAHNAATAHVTVKQPAEVLSSRALAPGVQLQTVNIGVGAPVKRLVTNLNNNAITNIQRQAPAREEAVSGVSLFEGFEGWDYTDGWQPDGWTILSKGEPLESDAIETWFVSDQGFYMPEPKDAFYEMINFSTEFKDEWLITPAATLTDFPMLYFYGYIDPIFLFDLNYVDWDAFEFTEVKPAANLQILVKEEGTEEWVVVRDFFEEYKDYSLTTLFNLSGASELELFSVDLSAFAGKTVQVAFDYVGTDGNTMLIDNVQLSNPSLEASYWYPVGTQYFGLSKDFVVLELSLPVLPVDEELYWLNMTEESDITSSWLYHDWASNQMLTSTDTDLAATYQPCYDTDFTCHNNCYNSPILTVSKPGASDGEFTIYKYFQAGGRAEWNINDSYVALGLQPFDFNTEGIGNAILDNDMEIGIPIYGYSADVDQFWTDYTFDGQEEEGEGVKMTGILNYGFTFAQPLVVSEAWVLGRGHIGADAVFTLDIIALNEEGNYGDILASATCRGSEMTEYEGSTLNDYTIPFTFDQPVVLSQDVCSAYVVRLSGFNDPANVTYFTPYQSAVDNPFGLALGWIEKEITMGGETHQSLSPTAYYTGFQSFSIMLDGVYPWLQTTETEVATNAKGCASVALGSYYDGSELTATQADGTPLPEWLSATITGRYGETIVDFIATGDQAADVPVLISAPGVSTVITVKYDGNASINSIISDTTDAPAQLFNVAGQQVSGNPAPGVYIQRSASGNVSKVIVK
ncbi:MAG: hypothetical protein ACI30X_00265 [Muribaculaceae bacterium]